MKILKTNYNDLKNILELQYLTYQSEAMLLNNFKIPPLKQSLPDIQDEYAKMIILKAVNDDGVLVGSVRAYKESNTVYIGKLIVNPEHQRRGIGTALLLEVEKICPSNRYELFTSDKSQNNIRLYEKTGYQKFKEQEVSPTLRLVYLEKFA